MSKSDRIAELKYRQKLFSENTDEENRNPGIIPISRKPLDDPRKNWRLAISLANQHLVMQPGE
jgi:hypothetical protein